MKMVPIVELVEPITNWNPQSEPEDTFTYVDLSAIDSQLKKISNASELLGSEAPSRARQVIRSGDVIVSTVRPNLNAVAHVPNWLDGATASTGFTVLRADAKNLHGRYLFHWTRTSKFVGQMTRLATGASYPAVSDRIVKSSEIPLPSLGEQRRIASILDMADALRAKRRQQLDHLDSLPQALFEQRFRDSARNRSFGGVLSSIETGVSPQCEARPAMNEEWGVLKLSAVTGGKYKSHENKAFLGNSQLLTKAQVRPGDLLMTRKNTPELVGQVAYVTDTPERLALPDLIFRLRLSEGSDARFYQTLLMSRAVRRDIQRLAGGAAASMSNIAGSRLKTLIIPDVPTHEQREFSAELVKIESLRTSIESASKESDQMFLALQSRAFRGEL